MKWPKDHIYIPILKQTICQLPVTWFNLKIVKNFIFKTIIAVNHLNTKYIYITENFICGIILIAYGLAPVFQEVSLSRGHLLHRICVFEDLCVIDS